MSYDLSTQKRFHESINKVLDKISETLNPDVTSNSHHLTYKDVTYRINDVQCFITFHLKALPEWLCCIKLDGIINNDALIKYLFFTQYEAEIRDFDFFKSPLRSVFFQEDNLKPGDPEWFNKEQINNILDIIKYILKEPYLAYCKAVYDNVDKEATYMTRIKSEYQYRSDARHRKIQDFINQILDKQLYRTLCKFIKRNFKPNKVELCDDDERPYHRYHVVMYYKDFPQKVISGPGMYDWRNVDNLFNKKFKKQERMMSFIGYYRYSRFSSSIEVRDLHNYKAGVKHR